MLISRGAKQPVFCALFDTVAANLGAAVRFQRFLSNNENLSLYSKASGKKSL